ncbi:hypothetical protein [Arthrobacter sp. UYCu712]|uniref:hypothetical protein n=1 Tax=Arthrobacter sp. UYCu712 TaxID=3156340 RepID=UPI0033909E6A
MSRGAPEPRKVTGWAAADMKISPHTMNAVARNNPHAAFPVSGDAKPRPSWMVLGHTARQALLNAPKAGTK